MRVLLVSDNQNLKELLSRSKEVAKSSMQANASSLIPMVSNLGCIRPGE
jgi:hypothetical protein